MGSGARAMAPHSRQPRRSNDGALHYLGSSDRTSGAIAFAAAPRCAGRCGLPARRRASSKRRACSRSDLRRLRGSRSSVDRGNRISDASFLLGEVPAGMVEAVNQVLQRSTRFYWVLQGSFNTSGFTSRRANCVNPAEPCGTMNEPCRTMQNLAEASRT
jgi:hypothetical protein